MDERVVSLFKRIKSEEYIVLRNWNELLEERFQDSSDIDLLCVNSSHIVEGLSLVPRKKKDDLVHYQFEGIKIDLWSVDCGYYCEKWGREAIENKELYDGLFYIPTDEDWLYLLIYHIVIQKESIPDKYKGIVLAELEKRSIPIARYDRDLLIKILEDHMRKNNYEYTYSKYGFSNVNFRGVSKILIRNDYGLRAKKALKATMNWIKGKGYRVVKWVKK